MTQEHKDIVSAERHEAPGFETAANETAYIKNSSGVREFRSLTTLGATGPQGPAGTTLTTIIVSSIGNPAELSAETGVTQGDIILVYEDVSGTENPFAIYTWDTDVTLPINNPPFSIKATGGTWVQTNSSFFSGLQGLKHVSTSKFHGKGFHVHVEGRWYFLHSGGVHQVISRNGYVRSALAASEVDFFENNDDVYKTKTLGSNTTLTFINYQHGDIRYLEIDSAASETLTFPSYVKTIGEYDVSGVVNYMRLEVIDEGTYSTGTVTVTNNAFDALDAVTVNGISFVYNVDWVAGDSVEETAVNIACVISASSNAALAGKIDTDVSGAVVTVTGRIGGVAGDAITLGLTDGATTNFTISGANLTGGIDGCVLAYIEQENNKNFTTANQTKLDGIETAATADQTAGEIEAIVNHDNLQNIPANDHIDWTAAPANDFHAGQEVQVNGQAFSGMNTLSDAATIATDCDNGNVHEVTLTDNRTLGAPTNLKDGATYLWIITQDVGGTNTLAYNAVFKFPGGTAPVLTTTGSAVDILTGVSDGTNIYCSLSKDFS